MDLSKDATQSRRAATEVSVIIPTYNRAHLVKRAVDSALAAMDAGDEIIVIDDGSTDQTEAALEPVRNRIRYLRIANGGAGKARNAGIDCASKPLIAFLDSDDVWLPFKLKMQRAALAEHPDLAFCCSNFSVRTAAGNEPSYLQHWWNRDTDIEKVFGNGIPFSGPEEAPPCSLHTANLYHAILRNGVVCLITLVYRKDKAPAARFPEDVPTYEDWEFTAQLARNGLGGYLECDTAINFGHPGSRLTDASALVCAETRLKILPRVWGSDPSFLAEHRADYDLAWSELNLRSARWLIRHGRNLEARAYLARVTHAPLTTRVWAALPVPKAAVDLVRNARAAFRRRP